MSMFVHLARESRVAVIRRNGIGRLPRARADRPAGILAVPVTRNFYVSHQWLRELKRRGQGAISGVYFRLPDEEPVWVGHYGRAHRRMTAAGAVAEFMGAESREGWEVSSSRAASDPRRSTGSGRCHRLSAGGTIREPRANHRTAPASTAPAESTDPLDSGLGSARPTANSAMHRTRLRRAAGVT